MTIDIETAADVFGDGGGMAAPLGMPRISDRVYALIREAVLTGQLAAGDRVVESDIARRLGVSQSPVRDAVRQLALEGLLTQVPRKGSFVAEVRESDVTSALVVRETIERLSASLAMDALSDEGIVRLKAHVAEMRAAAAEGNPSRFHDADVAFHREIVAITDNPVLQRVWEVLEASLRAMRAISDPLFSGDWLRLADEHATLLAALQSGDVETASQMFADHAAGRRSTGVPATR